MVVTGPKERPPRIRTAEHNVWRSTSWNAWVSSVGRQSQSELCQDDGQNRQDYKFQYCEKDGWVRTSHGVTTGPDGMIWITLEAVLRRRVVWKDQPSD